MQPIIKIALFIPIVLVGGMLYDYSYRHAYAHPKRYTLLAFSAAFFVGTWGTSLFTPWFTLSNVGFGLVAGFIMATSFCNRRAPSLESSH